VTPLSCGMFVRVQRLHRLCKKLIRWGTGRDPVCVNDSHKGGWMGTDSMDDGGWWGTGERSQV
jgi:hypothetical protein